MKEEAAVFKSKTLTSLILYLVGTSNKIKTVIRTRQAKNNLFILSRFSKKDVEKQINKSGIKVGPIIAMRVQNNNELSDLKRDRFAIKLQKIQNTEHMINSTKITLTIFLLPCRRITNDKTNKKIIQIIKIKLVAVNNSPIFLPSL